MANSRFTQFFYTKHMMPTLLDCNFVIDVANPNGLGIRSLKGPGIAQVFGNTSGTPAVFNGTTNNLPAGYFQIFFQDNYFRYYGGFSGFVTQVSGTPILVASAGVVKGTVYVIVSVGTTTAAGWQSLGLAVGITPAVGVTFVGLATTTATGTGAVEVPHVNGSGIQYLEAVGDAKLSLGPSGLGAGNPYIIVRTMSATNSSTTTPIATAPADNSVLGMSFYLSNSSVTVAGE